MKICGVFFQTERSSLVGKFLPRQFYLLNSNQEVICFSGLSWERMCTLIISSLGSINCHRIQRKQGKVAFAAYCAHPVLMKQVKPQSCVTQNLCWKKPVSSRPFNNSQEAFVRFRTTGTFTPCCVDKRGLKPTGESIFCLLCLPSPKFFSP